MRYALALLLVAAITAAAFLVLTSREDRTEKDSAEPPRAATTSPEPNAPLLVGTGEARALTADAGLGDAVIEVHTVDERGAPVAGVRVEVRRDTPDPSMAPPEWVAAFGAPPQPPEAIAAATTDGEGRLLLTGLPFGDYVRVSAHPAAPRVGASRWIAPQGAARAPVRLLIFEGGTVRGKLVDGSGRGLAGWISAHLPAVDSEPRLGPVRWGLPPQATDVDGTFVLGAVPPGLVHLDACVPGRGTLTCVPAQVPGNDVLLRLGDEDGCRITGRVSNAGGEPVAEGRIGAVIKREDDGGRATGLAISAADGTYEIRGLPAGALELVQAVVGEHEALHEPEEPERVAPGQTILCDLVLDGRATVRGVVQDEAGTAVAGVLVGASFGEYGWDRKSARSDGEGRYTIPGVPVGRVTLEVGGTGWSRQNAEPLRDRSARSEPGLLLEVEHDGQILEVDLVVRRGVRVEGRVVDESGRSVAGARVVARCPALDRSLRDGAWPRRTTDEAGAFAFESLRPSDAWRLDAVADKARSAPRTGLAFGSGETVRDLVLTVLPMASLAGRVVDSAGEPQTGFELDLDEEDIESVTNAEGTFTFSRLYAGRHTLWVRTGSNARFSQIAKKLTVDLAPGEARSDLVITTEHTLSMAGTVHDGEGRPVANTPLFLARIDTELDSARMTVTDPEGRFRYEGLEPGLYRPTVAQVELNLEVRAGDEDVRIVVTKGETWVLRGRVLDPAGQPVPKARIETRAYPWRLSSPDPGGEVRDGSFSIPVPKSMPAVTVEVSDAVAADGTPLAVMVWERENVTEDDVPLVIPLKSGRAVAGRVVDGRGRPIPGVKVFGAAEQRPRVPHLLATTDQRGRFDTSGLEPVALWFHFLPPPGWAMPDDVVVPPGTAELELVLEESTVFEGQVVDESGQPIERAVVVLTKGDAGSGANLEGEYMYDHLPWVFTNRQGRFRITTVGAGTYDVTVGAGPDRDAPTWPFLRQVVQDVSTLKTPLRVQLVRGVYIDLEVYEADGTPAPHCRVWMRPKAGAARGPRNVEPVEEGSHRFRAGPMPPGLCALGATRHGRGMAAKPIEVKAPATGVRLEFPPVLELRGRLDGLRAERFYLRFRATDDSGVRATGWSEHDGSFVIGLKQHAVGVLLARRDGDDRYALLEHVTPGGGPYTLRLENGLRIQGRTPDDAKIEHVFVTGPHGFSWPHDDDDGDASFEIRGLPPGRYDLWVEADDRRKYGKAGVVAGSRDVVLVPVED